MEIAISTKSYEASMRTGALRQADIVERIASLGFKQVELWETFLYPPPPGWLARLVRRAPALPIPTGQPDYSRPALQELRAARLRVGLRLACWSITTDLTLIGEAHKAQMAHIATALASARFLGAPLVHLTLGQIRDAPSRQRATETLRNVAVIAAAAGLKLAVENPPGLSAAPHTMAEIIATLAYPNVGAYLAWDNFAPAHFAAGVALLAPLAIYVHASTACFGPADLETSRDYPAALKALQAAHYPGPISIEHTGAGDPAASLAHARTALEKYP